MSLATQFPRRIARRMKFSLTYDGSLFSATDKHSRVRNKNELRFHFSSQLMVVADRGDFTRLETRVRPRGQSKGASVLTMRNFHGLYFWPLVARETKASCALSIKLMRPEAPGQIVHGGDLDNRLKTLLDALRLPLDKKEVLPKLAPAATADTLYTCLLEDDSLITELNISAVMLLTPIPKNHVRLVIDVELRPFDFDA